MCPYLMPWNRKTKQNRHWKNRRQNCLCYRESWQHRPEDAAAAQIEVDKKQAAYDEIKAMIMQLHFNAQADYNQKQQEEVTAKTEYKNAQNIVNTLEAALADAKDTQAEAQSKEERAKALSYDAAFLNQITDPDFTYLNDEISKVKDAQSREALLQKAYDAAKAESGGK